MNLETPLTCLITKGETTPENFEQNRSGIVSLVRAAARAGISMVQIREKRITAKQLFELAGDCREAIAKNATKLVVNGRPDIAKAAGADGVHLPEDGLPFSEVRRSFANRFLVGASVHSFESALIAKDSGADYVMFGPVFDTPDKAAKGIAALREVCNALGGFPVVAVGGIDARNYSQVLEAGAAGYAAIRYLNEFVRAK